MRALVVEDDATVRGAIGQLLTSMGFEVSAVRSAAEARWMLTLSLPAVMVLDLSLPDGSGIEVLRLIHQQRWNVDVAVLAEAKDPMLVEAIGLGVATVLERPMDPAALRRWLDGVLARRHSEPINR